MGGTVASDNYKRILGETKPVIAMVHLGALAGSPLYDAKAGIEGLVDGARLARAARKG
jgi:predicted TIM-barrel enzyme